MLKQHKALLSLIRVLLVLEIVVFDFLLLFLHTIGPRDNTGNSEKSHGSAWKTYHHLSYREGNSAL